MEKPKRAVEVTIKIGADTPEEVVNAILNIQFDFDSRGVREVVSGGPRSGWSTQVEFRPEQTHEKYHREVKAFLQYARRS